MPPTGRAGGRGGVLLERVPVDVAAGDQVGGGLLALEDDAEVGLVRREVDRGIEERLVAHHAAGLDAAGGGDDRLRPGVVDAHGELGRGEAAEDDGVDRAEAGAGEHRHQRLGNHRHVEDDAVTLADPARREAAGEAGDAVAELGIGDRRLRSGDRQVVEDRPPVAVARLDVAVDGVPAGVAHAVGEPAVEGGAAVVERLDGGSDPVDRFGRLHPEALGIGLPAVVDVPVCGHVPLRRLFCWPDGRGSARCRRAGVGLRRLAGKSHRQNTPLTRRSVNRAKACYHGACSPGTESPLIFRLHSRAERLSREAADHEAAGDDVAAERLATSAGSSGSGWRCARAAASATTSARWRSCSPGSAAPRRRKPSPWPRSTGRTSLPSPSSRKAWRRSWTPSAPAAERPRPSR